MIKVDLSQTKSIANLFRPTVAKNSKTIGIAVKTLPGVMLGAALTEDILTTSKSKEKSDNSPCAFWECTF